MHSIDFDKEFVKGSAAFEGFLADWWQEKSNDPAHRRAYRNISSKMHQTLTDAGIASPEFIVDYACGNGAILTTLANRFPETNIIAIDGSRKMLSLAKLALQQASSHKSDIQFIHSPLPNFSLGKQQADVVLFLFPNITISSKERRLIRKQMNADPLSSESSKIPGKME